MPGHIYINALPRTSAAKAGLHNIHHIAMVKRDPV